MESTIQMIEKYSKADQSLHCSVVTVVHTVITKVDVSKHHRENNKVNHEKDHSTVTWRITRLYPTDK